MTGNNEKKALENQEFINSDAARPIRILSEYLYPLHVFEEERITDTVVFFGSARIPSPEDIQGGLPDRNSNRRKKLIDFYKYYEQARELAAEITRWSRQEARPRGRNYVVCTGGGPGIMEACNRGATEAGGRSIGLNIDLPREQFSNPYIDPDLTFDFRYFFTRKYWFLYYARILIVFPGGFGTLDELFETLTLQQTNRIESTIPIVLFGSEFWDRVIDFQYLAEAGMISEEDLDLLVKVDTVPQALDTVLPYLKKDL